MILKILNKCFTVLLPIDLPFTKEPEFVLQTQIRRNVAGTNIYYKFRNNISLAFNGGFVYGSKIVGNIHLPRIMLGLFVSNIDNNIHYTKEEVFSNLYGFTKNKIRNEKQLTEWMNGYGKHEK